MAAFVTLCTEFFCCMFCLFSLFVTFAAKAISVYCFLFILIWILVLSLSDIFIKFCPVLYEGKSWHVSAKSYVYFKRLGNKPLINASNKKVNLCFPVVIYKMRGFYDDNLTMSQEWIRTILKYVKYRNSIVFNYWRNL